MQTRRSVALERIVVGFFVLTILTSLSSARAGGVVSSCSEASLSAALNGGGTVTFSADCTITNTQQIVINRADTFIDAAGHSVIISGGNAVPIFAVLTNLTIRGVALVNGASTNFGGAALYIQPGVVVIANNCVFAGNSVLGTNGAIGTAGITNSSTSGTDGGPGTQGVSALGGAIYNLGSLALSNCVLTNNSVTGGQGGNGGPGGGGGGTFEVGGDGGDGAQGGDGLGGAIYNLGDITLLNCTFSANTAVGGSGGNGGAGGAGTNPGRPGNGAAGGSGLGGAVYNARNLTLTGSTFSTNATHGGASATGGMEGIGTGKTGIKGAPAAGGAIYSSWWAVITNCTFYTNTVIGGAGGNGGNGGGTFAVPGNGGDGGDGVGGAIDGINSVTLVNCTFSSSAAFGGTNGAPGTGNFSGENGNFGASEGGNIANSGGMMIVLGSILSASGSGANAFGSFTDGGYNLSSDFSSSLQSLSFQNLNPLLGPLADNGGPTLTMALLTNSPAIDKIPPELSPAIDQRGAYRPINGLSDIGAFEFGASVTTTNVTLSIGRATNGLFEVTGGGTPGLTYFVQASTNLSNWETVSTNTAPILFTDPITNLSNRFYRITR